MGEGYEVVVIGAGPAGSAAARALARRGRRVLLCEKGLLPRHRLCGEFVSPEAVSDLGALGLEIEEVGAVPLAGARVAGGARGAESAFAQPAYAVTRRVLDAWLARAAEGAGAELRLETRVAGLRGDLRRGFEVDLQGARVGRVQARVVIGAYGKHAPAFQQSAGRADRFPGALLATPVRSSGAMGRSRSAARDSGWVAVEAHLEGVGDVAPRVELHAFAGGYVGVAPIGGGQVNVCAVVRSELLRARIRGAAGPSSAVDASPVQDSAVRDQRSGCLPAAARALANLVANVPTVASIWSRGVVDAESTAGETGFDFGRAHPADGDVLLVGDAAALPHPVGGDGIAMALRAGRLAAAHAVAFLEGRIAAQQLIRVYARSWDREFGARLRWCAALHGVLVRPKLVAPVVRLLSAWPAGMRFAIERTRGQALEIGGSV